MLNNKSVSIVIPTYNRPDFLHRAIASVVSQTVQCNEIIVVDDNSTEDNFSVISNFSSLIKIKYYKNESNRGACYCRNLGIKEAESDLIAFLDDDDEFTPEKIENVLNVYSDNLAYVTTGINYIHTDGFIEERIPKPNISLESILYRPETGICIVTSRIKLLSIGGFDMQLSSSQDYDLLVRLHLKYGDAVAVQIPLTVVHTEHEKPRITSSRKKINGHFSFYRKHKSVMNNGQRYYQLFKLCTYKNRKVKLMHIVYYLPVKMWLPPVKFYASKLFPRLKKAYLRVRS